MVLDVKSVDRLLGTPVPYAVFHSIPLSHLGSFRTYLRWAIADINGNPQSIPPMARGTCRAEPAPPAPPGPSFPAE
jgi:hypothetical protein